MVIGSAWWDPASPNAISGGLLPGQEWGMPDVISGTPGMGWNTPVGNLTLAQAQKIPELSAELGFHDFADQYRAALRGQGMGRYGAQRAAMAGFNPAYMAYEQFGDPGGTGEIYTDFTQYLQGGRAPTADEIRQRLVGAGTATLADDPSDLYGQYFEGTVPDQYAQEKQLAMLDAMRNARQSRTMQTAAKNVIDRLFQDYLATGASPGIDSKDEEGKKIVKTGMGTPGGFLRYYMGKRGISDDWTPAAGETGG